MERLTIRTPNGAALIMGDSYTSEAAARADLMHRYLIAVDRLAAYEDSGLEPEEVIAAMHALMGKAIAEIEEFDGVPVSRLRELARADKDRRLVVLPPPAKFGEPKPECFYNDCSGIWCLGYSHDGDDEPTERCKRCWYCDNGDYADGAEAETALGGEMQ